MSLIHKHLPAALDGHRVAARALHIGSSFAGAGAGNALLGAGHALAHQLSAHFPSLAPGACCALVLANVVAYNAVDASRLTVTPLYAHADGLDRVALLSNHLSLAPVTWSREAKRDAVVGALVDLRALCGLPSSLHEAGLSTADFAAVLPGMALGAFKDPILACVTMRAKTGEPRELFAQPSLALRPFDAGPTRARRLSPNSRHSFCCASKIADERCILPTLKPGAAAQTDASACVEEI